MIKINLIKDKKVCIRCKILKDSNNFTSLREKRCKECMRLYNKEYRLKNFETIANQTKEYRNKNRDKLKIYHKEYRAENLDKIKERNFKNKKINNENRRIRVQNNPEKYRIKRQIYRENNRDKINKRMKKYRENKYNKINRDRWQKDVSFKLSHILKHRLFLALKGDFRSGSAIRNLGCSIEDFKKYMESKFYPNPKTGEIMSWDNWSVHGWHIDHIIPISSFDLTDREQLLKACHYTNLQPRMGF
ncbi:MAG: hypothetical protein KGO96_07425 [Elusimicrobia bacterium]|nr:hypothetical protein [Elusimicrobiota bacterium]